MNPNDMSEVCECGHEESDHTDGEAQADYLSLVEISYYCEVPGCECDNWRPKDDQFYAEREVDARAEKWESSRE